MKNTFKHTKVIAVLLTLAGATFLSLPAEARDGHPDRRGYDRYDRYDRGNHYGHRKHVVHKKVVVVPAYQHYSYWSPRPYGYYYPASYYRPYRPSTVFSFNF